MGRKRWFSRWWFWAMAALPALAGGAVLWGYLTMFRMPGESYQGPLEPQTEIERELERELREHVVALAGRIGERNLPRHQGLSAAAEYLSAALGRAGLEVRRQPYSSRGLLVENLEVERPGTSRREEIVVVGAHYDSVAGTVGANDNASGVAAALALARAFIRRGPARSVRFVFFANEEPPYFQTPDMGSLVYARRCQERGEKVVGMLSLETIGYYSDAQGSQSYPFPMSLFYPRVGNFIAFVGNTRSGDLVRRVVASFRRHTRFPSEGAAIPAFVPEAGFSDHWSFWKAGYPALMVTDTAPFRYPHYHAAGDTPDKLCYDRLARVVAGLEKVILELANPQEASVPAPPSP